VYVSAVALLLALLAVLLPGLLAVAALAGAHPAVSKRTAMTRIFLTCTSTFFTRYQRTNTWACPCRRQAEALLSRRDGELESVPIAGRPLNIGPEGWRLLSSSSGVMMQGPGWGVSRWLWLARPAGRGTVGGMGRAWGAAACPRRARRRRFRPAARPKEGSGSRCVPWETLTDGGPSVLGMWSQHPRAVHGRDSKWPSASVHSGHVGPLLSKSLGILALKEGRVQAVRPDK
jgi:hypothetical protein